MSSVTVWSVLNYMTDSKLANMIRKAELADGGRTGRIFANCQTKFVHGDDGHVQRVGQTFSNGVRVMFDCDACEAAILRDGKPVRTSQQLGLVAPNQTKYHETKFFNRVKYSSNPSADHLFI